MSSIHRTLQRLALAVLSAAAFVSQAEAAAVVSISPSSQNVAVGGTASIDIIVSGLTQSVGGFQFDLGFNNSFLSMGTRTLDPGAKMGVFDPLNDFSSGPGNFVYLANLSFPDEAALAASEGASFTLARVSFLGLADGLSALTLSNVVLSDFSITVDLANTTVNGAICVGNCAINPVPEPETIVLVATGLAALGLRRRRRAK
jgi:hypothetical protein